MRTFRLIVDPPGPGRTNMALDQALLESPDHAEHDLVLRLYQWSRPTLSLGYFQSVDSRNEHGPSREIDFVRRATGGGAIVHHHDLTYSIVTSLSDRWASKHRALYDAMHYVIIEVLASWGVNSTLWEGNRKRDSDEGEKRFLCFQRRANGDIVLGNEKIGGSAQRRNKTALLQHGSILLARSNHAPELPGISDLTGHSIDADELSNRIITAFSAAMGLQPVRTDFTEAEQNSSAEWLARRFGNSDWNEKKQEK